MTKILFIANISVSINRPTKIVIVNLHVNTCGQCSQLYIVYSVQSQGETMLICESSAKICKHESFNLSIKSEISDYSSDFFN